VSLEDDLENFFASDAPCVVANPEQFRKKLNIGAEAFKFLSAAKTLGAYSAAMATGAGAAGAAGIGWAASLGTLGQIGLVLGMVSTPTGWVAAAGVSGAAAVLLTRKLLNSISNEVVTEIPNFINTPLDVLAASLTDILAPVLLHIANSDGEFCEVERNHIRQYFINEWGLDANFTEDLLQLEIANRDHFDWQAFASLTQEVAKTGDIKHEVLLIELMSAATEVARADGEMHLLEQQQLNELALIATTEPSKLDTLYTELTSTGRKLTEGLSAGADFAADTGQATYQATKQAVTEIPESQPMIRLTQTTGDLASQGSEIAKKGIAGGTKLAKGAAELATDKTKKLMRIISRIKWNNDNT